MYKIAYFLFIFGTVNSQSCEQFHSDKVCQRTGLNIVQEIPAIATEADCQLECQFLDQCSFFSWIRFEDDSGSDLNWTCILWMSCDTMEDCGDTCFYSLTGPKEPAYPEACCDQFSGGQNTCTAAGDNLLQTLDNVPSASACQMEFCQANYPLCKYFVYQPSSLQCLLLSSCSAKEDSCGNCLSGPVFPSVDYCGDITTPEPVTTPEPSLANTAILLAGKLGLQSDPGEVESWPCVDLSSPLPLLPLEIGNVPGAALLDGTIYLCGGEDMHGHKYRDNCLVLKEGERTEWLEGQPMLETRGWFTLNTVGKSLVAAFGHGENGESSSIEIFRDGFWDMTPLPLDTISRRSHCAVTISDEEIVFIGGTSSKVSEPTLTTMQTFNTNTGVLASLSNMPGEGRKGLACTLFQGEVMVTGGYTGSQYLTSVISYNIGSGEWKTMEDLNHIRSYHTLGVINGNPVVFGSGLVGTLEIFRDGQWMVEEMRVERSHHAMVVLPCNQARIHTI